LDKISFFGCYLSNNKKKEDVMPLELKSSAFADEETIPDKYTCQGDDVSPPLEWNGTLEDTKAFVLICDDPDAPMGTWDHWVIYNIPSDRKQLDENIEPSKNVKNMTQGLNSWDKIGWGGPCPPPGPAHRYIFHLYALDEDLDMQPGLTKNEVLEMIDSHIIDDCELMGKYQR
jgi:hypothetical protein